MKRGRFYRRSLAPMKSLPRYLEFSNFVRKFRSLRSRRVLSSVAKVLAVSPMRDMYIKCDRYSGYGCSLLNLVCEGR